MKMRWVDQHKVVSLAAFLPNRGDTEGGISLSRARQGETPEQTAQRVAATGTLGNDYYVAVMVAGALLDGNVPIAPDPTPDDPFHVQVEGWTYSKRDDEAVRSGAEKAASVVGVVYGPFPGHTAK